MEATPLTSLARTLDSAMLEAREIERLTVAHPDLSLVDAYRIQDEGIRLRLARGEKVVGLKMGLTSKAKREQMGLHTSIYGVLTDRMRVADGGTYPLKGQIHPKIEPEIAFMVGRELRGKITSDEALEACTGVFAAMEILDSRFKGFKYFSLPDVVADNSSSSQFIVSEVHRDPREVKLANLQMVLEIDGKPVETGFSHAILGNPINSIVELCAILDSRGLSLPAGTLVLAGAATQAVQLAAGMRVRLTVQELAGVTVNVTA